MSSNSNSINSITGYSGLVIFIFGTVGNAFNIRLFWRSRRNSCAFIFLFLSLNNSILLFYGLLTRALAVGFQLDWSNNNRIWCKIRATLTPTSFLISLTCTCLASVDRFLASCRQERYRKFSRLSTVIPAVFITNILWFINCFPYLIYAELVRSPTTGLMSCILFPNEIYTKYLIYIALPVYYGILPTVVLIVTGLLTYRNMNKLRVSRQRKLIQRQLTLMMLILIPIILFSTLPYVIFTEYTVFTASIPKSSYRRGVELLIGDILTNLCYVSFACPFYAFLASSSAFREEAKLICLCHRQALLQPNQVQPYCPNNTGNIKRTFMNTNQNGMLVATITNDINPIVPIR